MIDLKEIRAEFADLTEPRLLRLLNSVASIFEKRTRRLWSYRTDYIFVFPIIDIDCKHLWVSLLPITSVSVAQRLSGETDFEAVDIEEYVFNSATGKISNLVTTWSGEVKLTVTGGLTNAQILEQYPEIVDAIITQMKFQNMRFSGDNLIINSHSVENKSTSFLRGQYHPQFENVCNMHTRH